MTTYARYKARRGVEAARLAETPVEGEIIVTSDEMKGYIGDGSKAGGYVVNADNCMAVWPDQGAAANKHSLAWWIARLNGAEGTIRIPAGTHAVLSDVTVPENVSLKFDKGAILSVASGKTLTINGPVDACLWQIFAGAGTVAGKPQITAAYPQWFGAVGDGVTDDTTALQKSINFGNHNIIPSGTYLVTKASLESLADYALKPSDNSVIDFAANAVIKLETGVDVRHIIGGTGVTNITMHDVNIDGNNSACNGLGFTHASNVKINSVIVKNIKAAAQTYTSTAGLGGGKGINFEYACNNIHIDNISADNCFIAVNVVGSISNPSERNTVSHLHATNCNIVCAAYGNNSTGLTTTIAELNTDGVIFSDITFKNCGSSVGCDNRVNFSFTRQTLAGNCLPWMAPARADATYSNQYWLMGDYDDAASEWSAATASYAIGDKIKYTNIGLDACIIAVDQSSGVQINNVQGYNDASYGKIGAVIRGLMKNVSADHISVSVNTDYIYRNGPVPVLSNAVRNFARSQNIKVSNCNNLGVTAYVVGSDGPIGVTNPITPYYAVFDEIGIQQSGNIALCGGKISEIVSSSAASTWLKVRNLSNGGTVSGNLYQMLSKAITDAS